MDSQAFSRNRRVFILTSAVAAAGLMAVGCDTPQGMRSPKRTPPLGGGDRPGQNPAGTSGAPASPSEAGPKQGTEPATKTEGDSGEASVDRPAPPSKEPAIRIRTREVPPTKPLVTIEGHGPKVWIVEKGSGKGGVLAKGPVEARWTPNGWRITEQAGTRGARPVAYESFGTLDVSCLSNEPQRITIDGVTWPGSVRLVPIRAGFDLVHEVAMETYLSGVIAKELINGWGVETHRAQAVAARSFAVCEMAVWRPQRHYDVVADERSQAWVGATTHRTSLDAVRDTVGEVLVYENRVVPAYYSSCCGGARASAQDTISSEIRHDIAPLRASSGRKGCACTGFSRHANWEMRLGVDSISRTLPGWARLEGYPSLVRFGNLREITVVSRNELGRPVRVRLIDDKGWKCELSAERLRWALSADPADPSRKKPLKDRVKSAYFDPQLTKRELVLKGAGYGHGVGLCQYGSEAMAKSGASARAILANYYPGARIVRAYT